MQTALNRENSEAPPGTPPGGGAGRPTGQSPSRARRRLLPWAVVAFWLVILGITGPLAGQLGESQQDDALAFLPSSAESTRVAELERSLPGGNTLGLIVVYHREDGLTAEDQQAIATQLNTIAADHPHLGDEPLAERAVPAEDGRTVMYPLALTGLDGEDEETAAVAEIRESLADGAPDGLQAQLGGPGAISADMEEVFSGINDTLMIVTFAVVTLLLILIYRSPLLWLLPLICVAVAAGAAMALVYALVQMFDLTVTAQSSSIMTVLVFGAGTDYALLLIARYREELRRHRLAYDAMLAAIRGCGPAVLASSGTVAAGLLCLLAADVGANSGLGVVGSVGVLCAVAVLMTLLPALLVLCGRRIFWPLSPQHGDDRTPRWSIFARLGGSVARRPVRVLASSLLLLTTLALGILAMPGQLKDEDVFINTPESVSAMQLLSEEYPERSSRPITVLATDDQAGPAQEAAEGLDGVVDAVPGRGGDGWTEISVFAADPPESDEEKETVRELRAALAEVVGANGGEALVGGDTAQQMDGAEAASRDIRMVIPLVLITVLVVLIALLRALTAPLMLLAAVVVSWASALGLSALAFTWIFGFEGLASGVPLMSFVFSVALGVDYGIFLMHRTREEVLSGKDTPRAAISALRTTGGVIASAGVVLAATFAALTTLPLVMMVQIGFVIAVGVLLDTFLVRTYVLTSATWLLGNKVWWPGPLYRRPPGAGTDRDGGSAGSPDGGGPGAGAAPAASGGAG